MLLYFDLPYFLPLVLFYQTFRRKSMLFREIYYSYFSGLLRSDNYKAEGEQPRLQHKISARFFRSKITACFSAKIYRAQLFVKKPAAYSPPAKCAAFLVRYRAYCGRLPDKRYSRPCRRLPRYGFFCNVRRSLCKKHIKELCNFIQICYNTIHYFFPSFRADKEDL